MKKIDLWIEEKINHENFEKSKSGRETYESIAEVNLPTDFDSDFPIVILLIDSNEKDLIDPRVQAMFKWSTHSRNVFLFLIRQDY